MDSASRALHAHRLLMRLGFGMVSSFVWVFLFEFFALTASSLSRAMFAVAIVYAFSQGIALLLTPITAAHLRRGIRPAMIAGTLALSAAFVVLGATLSGSFGESPLLWGVLFFAFLFGAYRALYWIPYRIQGAAHREPNTIIIEVVIALMPAVAGLTIATIDNGPERVLFGAAAFLVLSLIPVATLPDIHELFSWNYIETFRQLYRPHYRSISLHGFFDGVQGATLFLVWPLAVFLIVNASYLTFGLIFSATLLVLLILHKPLQDLLSRSGLRDSASVLLTLAVSGWIFRLAVATPLSIIYADSYSYLGAPRGKSADIFSFEQSADASSYIDEYSALKELSLAFGRIALCLCFATLLYFFSIPVAIAGSVLIAAVASAAAVLLSRRMSLSI